MMRRRMYPMGVTMAKNTRPKNTLFMIFPSTSATLNHRYPSGHSAEGKNKSASRSAPVSGKNHAYPLYPKKRKMSENMRVVSRTHLSFMVSMARVYQRENCFQNTRKRCMGASLERERRAGYHDQSNSPCNGSD